MINYDNYFNDDPNHNFFYNAPGYGGKKFVVGAVSLNNAIARLDKDEYYALVSYIDGEKLPEGYIPFNKDLGNGDLLATVDPKLNFQDICRGGGIQKISKLSNDDYLLGPGPDTFNLPVEVNKLFEEYKKEISSEQELTGSRRI